MDNEIDKKQPKPGETQLTKRAARQFAEILWQQLLFRKARNVDMDKKKKD